MKSEKRVCIQCEQEKWIQNKRGICQDCVYQNNHNGKTRFEIQKERSSQRKKVSSTNHKKANKNTFKPKKTGEKELFLEIWKDSLHICENCGKFLGHEPKPFMFSHIKSKGSHPELRLDKSNIQLLCFDCHYAYDHQSIEVFKKRNKD